MSNIFDSANDKSYQNTTDPFASILKKPVSEQNVDTSYDYDVYVGEIEKAKSITVVDVLENEELYLPIPEEDNLPSFGISGRRMAMEG